MLGTVYGGWLAYERMEEKEDVVTKYSGQEILNKEGFIEVMKRDGDDF